MGLGVDCKNVWIYNYWLVGFLSLIMFVKIEELILVLVRLR